MKHLENDNLNELIASGLYLVDFYASWCMPCKMLSPILENISSKIDVIKVDIDKNEKTTLTYNIMSVPTLIFFKNGKELERVVGYHEEDELIEIIENIKNI